MRRVLLSYMKLNAAFLAAALTAGASSIFAYDPLTWGARYHSCEASEVQPCHSVGLSVREFSRRIDYDTILSAGVIQKEEVVVIENNIQEYPVDIATDPLLQHVRSEVYDILRKEHFILEKLIDEFKGEVNLPSELQTGSSSPFLFIHSDKYEDVSIHSWPDDFD